MNGPAALEICARGQCDIVLLDVMMPGMDGHEVCRRLKGNPRTAHIPVVMITALDQPADRVAGLEAGADDFLTKPVNDIALITRVKRSRPPEDADRRTDDARLYVYRDRARRRLRSGEPWRGGWQGAAGRRQPVDHRPRQVDPVAAPYRRSRAGAAGGAISRCGGRLRPRHRQPQSSSRSTACACARTCARFDRTRLLPILVIVDPDDNVRLLRGLDLGVNDYLVRPVDRNEMLARVKTQVRRKRFSDRLRDNVQMTIEMAVTDGLTGLHNRRYLERHLVTLVQQAIARREAAVRAGPRYRSFQVDQRRLRPPGRRRRAARILPPRAQGGARHRSRLPHGRRGNSSLPCPTRMRRWPFWSASASARRSRWSPSASRKAKSSIEVTVSIGISSLVSAEDTPETLLKRADEALYEAKRAGRNRVAAAA